MPRLGRTFASPFELPVSMNFFAHLTLTSFLATTLLAHTAKTTAPGSPVELQALAVCAEREGLVSLPMPALPATASVTAQIAEDTVNLLDPEDAVKYLPSVFLRKRNYGDTQAVMGTRIWGVSSSARSLVFADGVPLSALIANNNSIGAPRWGLVGPAEMERIEVMHGPFSAAYAGNSMGAVMEIATRQPEKFEGSLTETMAWQSFRLYGTENTFRTLQTTASIGDRVGKFSFRVSANYQDSHSQPLSFVTSSTFPSGTTGGFAEKNKLGATANVLGAGGLLHTHMTNAKIKAAYDLTPSLRASYTFGFWQNDADSSVETYLRDAAGEPTFAGQPGFASGYYQLFQQHSSHSLTLKTDTKSDWDFEAVATRYRFDDDKQRMPTTASATGTGFSTAGRTVELSGTGWSTFDLKGTWHRGGRSARHIVSFGAHDDRYELFNPTSNTPDWSADAPPSSVATAGNGKTRTQALWAQDVWQISPTVKFTLGGRYEKWRAYDGYNANGTTVVRQPNLSATKFSPKATLAWTAAPRWLITASFGRAYRFATAAELYQLISTGSTFTAPTADLKPDNVLATELRFERQFNQGRLRISFFQDEIRDAIISQFNPLLPGSTQLFSYLSNVDRVRARGIELTFDQGNVFVRGLDLSGSVTYLDARTLAISGRASAAAPAGSAIGKRLPNIPDWRATFVVTWRPTPRWTFTAAGRYSGMLYTTLDNTDVNPNTWQGFAAWFVADAHVRCQIVPHWSATLGVDNVLNRKYFIFHPFPQRTAVAQLKYAF